MKRMYLEQRIGSDKSLNRKKKLGNSTPVNRTMEVELLYTKDAINSKYPILRNIALTIEKRRVKNLNLCPQYDDESGEDHYSDYDWEEAI